MALGVGGKGSDRCAFGINHFKHRALQGDGRAFLVLEDFQAGLGGFLFRGVGVVAVCRQSQRRGRIGIAHVFLQVAILVLLGAHSVVDGVLIDIGTKAQLDAAALSIDCAGRIQDLELSGISLSGGLGGDDINFLVVHINDLRAGRNRRGIAKGNIYSVVAHPGFRSDREDLLEIFLTIDGCRIGGLLVGFHRDIRRKDSAPYGAATVDILHGCQHLIGTLQLHSGQIGVDLHVVDVPVGQQVRPERHFGRIVCLILILQLEFAQTAMGIAICNDAHDFGITADFVGEVLDALTGSNSLRYTLDIGVDAVRRDFFRLTAAIHIVVVGIDQLTHSAVDRQVTELLLAVVDVDFSKRLFDRTGCQSYAWKHTKHHDNCEKHRNNSFFHFD